MTDTQYAGRARPIDDVSVGEKLPDLEFPITVYRLVMEAGANRDFNSIHHNSEYARATGAPEMYANTLFLMGMWERSVRDWAGSAAEIIAIRGFRMGRFSVAGTTTKVRGTVAAVTKATGEVTIELRCEDEMGITVGPGEVVVRFPVTKSLSD
ncbi:acyl dehydratase [Rhodococcus erythropolis]|uniref:acyl dehydratase n=1 Tax=Rhodococcus erythropolis TaxID=1833 RepID=UPI0037B13404